MKKSKLLEQLDNAINTEESATRIYYGHLNTLFGETGLSDDKIAKARAILDYLITENKKHKSILDAIKDKILMENRDDY